MDITCNAEQNVLMLYNKTNTIKSQINYINRQYVWKHNKQSKRTKMIRYIELQALIGLHVCAVRSVVQWQAVKSAFTNDGPFN